MNSGANARTLSLFFIDGKPDGMLTAKFFNWIGHVLVTPRTRIKEALARDEAGHTGIYMLLGQSDDGSSAYVGEAENLRERIRSHEKTKEDWWERVVLVTAANNVLDKADAMYLEAQLIAKAYKTDPTCLANKNRPTCPSLGESAAADLDIFLEHLYTVLPAIRIDLFLDKQRPTQQKPMEAQLEFELRNKRLGLEARAVLEGGEFIVQCDSLASLNWTSDHRGYGPLHERLVQIGILKEREENCIFTENYAFNSPSAAAAIVNGRPTNGRTAWKIRGTSTTFHQWEIQQLLEGDERGD